MKQISIRVAPARVPTGMQLTHVSTSYRISKSPDMEDESNIIFESLEDMTNLLEIQVPVDILGYQTVYCASRYHYIDGGGVNYMSKWSPGAPVNAMRHGLTYPGTIVKTPKVEQELDLDGIFSVYTNPMEIFTGVGNHEMTSWVIKDSDGFPVYVRQDDKDNKTKLYPEFVPEKNKAYIIEAQHTVTGNNDSFTGRSVYLNYTKGYALYDFEVFTKFYVDTNVWHRLKIYVPNFKEYDLEIRKPDGTVVKKLYNCTILVYYINTFGFQYNNVYEWWVRVRFTDNSVTDFRKEWEGLALDKDESPDWDDDPNIAFLGKIADGPTWDIESEGNNLTQINSYEINSKEFFYAEDGFITLLKWENNSIKKIKNLLDLKTLNPANDEDKNIDDTVIPYVTFTKTDDFRVMIHYRVQNNNSQWGKTIFLLCEYNPIGKELILIAQNEFKDEVSGLGISNSLVRKTRTNWYATMETDPTITPYREGLRIMKIEVTDEAINLQPYIVIKRGRYAFAKLLTNKNKDLFVVGGSSSSHTNIDTGELYFKRNNNDVLRINFNQMKPDKEGVWESLPDTFNATRKSGNLPTEYSPFTNYDFMPVSLGSGEVLLFNNCNSGERMFNQDVLVYSTVSGLFKYQPYDLKLKVPFRNIVRFNNWDILRISSNVESKQVTYIYLSAQNKAEDFKDSSKEATYPTVITFKDKITNVEVPYHFTKGDNGNPDDKEIIHTPFGKEFNWVDKKQYRKLTFSNILYTRSQLQGLVEEGLPTEWTRGINVLNNVHLKIGLGQIIGENSYQAGHGANPWPYEPYIKDPGLITLKGTETKVIKFDHNAAELEFEFPDNNSKSMVAITIPDPEKDRFNITFKGLNKAGTFKVKFIGLGVDGEPYSEVTVTGQVTI